MTTLRNWILATAVIATAAMAAWADAAGGVAAQGWRTEGSGVYLTAKTPAEWGPDKNVIWKTPIDNCSNAIPVIVGNKIFIEAEKDQLLCLNADGVVYFMCGEQGCKAFKLPEKVDGDNLALTPLWSGNVRKKDRTYSSPVVFEGLVYVINQGGNLSAIDAKTGAIAWEQEMKLEGTTYPSLVIAGTVDGPRLLVSSDSGKTALLIPGKTFNEVARNKLEGFRTTPVCVKTEGGDRMYIRGLKNMWCFGENK